MAGRPAVLLDRDGTLTEPRHYPSSPSDLVLQAAIAEPLRELQDMGVALVMVTNQSGLARGYFAERDLTLMHTHVRTGLDELGVRLDGIYFCPHHPDGVIAGLAVPCACRKPEPGMLLRAARELGLDLGRSWMVGDFATDVEAGRRAGCRTAWVGPHATEEAASQPRNASEPTLRAPTTAEALMHIVRSLRETP
ncbi:D-glycero-alpha-D-manno-heptose-1,7-bisphosphate 7-phosphatase [Streptomyces sp. NPDC059629]|uniref:D-glycero-alpha-D-manno-heptose-1,7-bisphosphate 7-phosphatase n=1 Tax=Streptomyces sp. NPDC059629 TaxID=3346889 RepID=UPI0036791832